MPDQAVTQNDKLSPNEDAAIRTVPTGLFIDGRWQEADNTMPVVDPSTERELCAVADASPADGMRALDAAAAAQDSWAQTSPRERSTILSDVYRLMIENVDRLALVMTLEMGKPLAEARGEVSYAAEFFRWFAE